MSEPTQAQDIKYIRSLVELIDPAHRTEVEEAALRLCAAAERSLAPATPTDWPIPEMPHDVKGAITRLLYLVEAESHAGYTEDIHDVCKFAQFIWGQFQAQSAAWEEKPAAPPAT